MSNKEDKFSGGTGGNGGNGDSLCKKVKFTLIVTLHFDNKTSEKLKSHFNSKPDVSGCNLPNKKDFVKAYRKLMKKYSESLPKDSKPKIQSRSTQIWSTVGQNTCSNGGCSCQKGDSFSCGTKKKGPSCCKYSKGTQDGDKCTCWFK